jgi:hypothetical protein
VLHPLERDIESERGASGDGEGDRPPSTDGSDTAEPSSGTPGADDVPEDVYQPEFGVMVLCDSEQDQQAFYKWLQTEVPDRKIRVVAV